MLPLSYAMVRIAENIQEELGKIVANYSLFHLCVPGQAQLLHSPLLCLSGPRPDLVSKSELISISSLSLSV